MPTTASNAPPVDRITELPSLGQALPLSFLDALDGQEGLFKPGPALTPFRLTPVRLKPTTFKGFDFDLKGSTTLRQSEQKYLSGFQPGSFKLDRFKTSLALEAGKADADGQLRPVKLKAESRLDERFAGFSSGGHKGELRLEGQFKASADGFGGSESASFSPRPTGLESQLGLRQSFSGDVGRLSYRSQLFARQSVSPLFMGQDLPASDYGASAGFSYRSGGASLGFDAASTALGADSLTTRLDYRQGQTALSLSAGQEQPALGEGFSKYGAELKVQGKGALSAYLGGELRSLGNESLKAGLSYASGRTRLSTEASSSGAAQSFNRPILSHSLAYQLGKAWDLKLGARPQATAVGEQRYSLGVQGKF